MRNIISYQMMVYVFVLQFICTSTSYASSCDSAVKKAKKTCDNEEMRKNSEIKMTAANLACNVTSGGSKKADCMQGVAKEHVSDLETHISGCSQAKKGCESACTKPEDQSKLQQCKKDSDEAISQAEGAKEQAQAAGKSGEGLGQMLGALAGLASQFMNKDKKEEEKKEEEKKPDEPADATSSGKRLLSSGGYRAYSAGEGDGEKDLGGAGSALTASNGSSGGLSGSNGSGGGGNGINLGGGGTFGSGGLVGAASVNNDDGFDKNLSDGFYGAGGGSKNDPGDYSGGGGSAPFSQASLDSGSPSAAYSRQKLQNVLDQAKAMGRAPAGLAHFGANDGTGPYGDNFNRVHERYRMINFSEQLEDVD